LPVIICIVIFIILGPRAQIRTHYILKSRKKVNN